MRELAGAFIFAGSALLAPDADRIRRMAAELGEEELADAAGPGGTLEPEYNRLFLNPGGSPCSLWQSAWEPESHLMGAPHLKALEWYRRYGVEPAASNDPADHVGLLLLFYARLLEGGVPAEERVAFSRDHLGWVPAFCRSVMEETKHPFYRGLAGITRELAEGAHEAEDPR